MVNVQHMASTTPLSNSLKKHYSQVLDGSISCPASQEANNIVTTAQMSLIAHEKVLQKSPRAIGFQLLRWKRENKKEICQQRMKVKVFFFHVICYVLSSSTTLR